MICGKCDVSLVEVDMLRCASCRVTYHYACLSISEVDFKKILPMNKSKWKCSSCKKPKHNLSPIHPPTSVLGLDMEALIRHIDAKFDSLRRDIQDDIQTTVRSSIESQLQIISQTVQGLECRLDNLESITKGNIMRLDDENKALRSELLTLRSNCEDMEQRARSCNVEIQNVPEKRGEDLCSILDVLCKLIDVPLHRDHIRSVHRVAHNTNTNIERPRNIVVQLTTRRIRDDILAAARIRRGLSSDRLGLGACPGRDQRIFVNEHLTLQNKILYSKARSAARAAGYRFVWIKNAKILVRKADDSKVLVIRGEGDLVKL